MHPLKVGCCLILLMVAGCYRSLPVPVVLAEDRGEQKTFDYHGIKINYYESGQGRPLLLIHGFGASSFAWRHLTPPLAERRRVIAIDLKGYGLSDKPRDGHYAVSDQADLVVDFIRRLDLKDLDLAGHSMGGGVALLTCLKLAEENDGRLRRLILIDSAGYPQKMPWFIAACRIPVLSALGAKLLSPRFMAAMVLRKSYYDRDKVTEELIDGYAAYAALPGAKEAVLQTARQIVPEDLAATTERYRTIKVPVLIIWGAQDRVVPLEVGHRFKQDIANSELAVIPRCGHVPPEEEPLATRRLVEAFLEK